jgi:hypothetical protein
MDTRLCTCGTDPAASPLGNWDSSCPVHPGAGRVARLARCQDCGHVHVGDAFASICVGCPCPARPGLR